MKPKRISNLLNLSLLSKATSETFQIKSTQDGLNQQTCLTFQQTKTMAAYDPITQNQAGYPLATWEPCDSTGTNHYQLFEMNMNGQIINPSLNKC